MLCFLADLKLIEVRRACDSGPQTPPRRGCRERSIEERVRAAGFGDTPSELGLIGKHRFWRLGVLPRSHPHQVRFHHVTALLVICDVDVCVINSNSEDENLTVL